MDHRHRQLPTLDHYFRACTHPREQPSKVIGGVRFRDVDHMVSHATIIPAAHDPASSAYWCSLKFKPSPIWDDTFGCAEQTRIKMLSQFLKGRRDSLVAKSGEVLARYARVASFGGGNGA